MWKISNEHLIHSYEEAVHLGLDDDFLKLLQLELDRRGLKTKSLKKR